MFFTCAIITELVGIGTCSTFHINLDVVCKTTLALPTISIQQWYLRNNIRNRPELLLMRFLTVSKILDHHYCWNVYAWWGLLREGPESLHGQEIRPQIRTHQNCFQKAIKIPHLFLLLGKIQGSGLHHGPCCYPSQSIPGYFALAGPDVP